MKEKILAELGKKYPGLSKLFLGFFADKMATKITEESAIEGAVAELEKLPVSLADMAAEYQKEGDRRVTDAEKTFKAKKEKESEEKDKSKEKEKEKEGGDDPIAKLTSMVANLTTELTNYKKEGTQKSLSQKLSEKLAEKKIPALLAKGRVVESEEELDTVVAEIEADHTTYKQGLINEELKGGKPPAGGVTVDAAKTKVEADIGSWADSHKPIDSQKK
ncbi:hypothetical protein AB6805_30600 [Chitinophaga sp. RCC_12]|uniref:hypothetical protein n=1 Tax=Chitinophaga sp. RCC_12 TaxID=3239226 RepID=UPI0035252ECB